VSGRAAIIPAAAGAPGNASAPSTDAPGARGACPPGAGFAASAAVPEAVSFGCWNVAGMGSIRHRLMGATITNARPTTWFSGMVPLPGSLV